MIETFRRERLRPTAKASMLVAIDNIITNYSKAFKHNQLLLFIYLGGNQNFTSKQNRFRERRANISKVASRIQIL